jgi:hypothetical protein
LKTPKEPGMLMKKQPLANRKEISMAAAKNQAIENNRVTKSHGRLDEGRKQHIKMKVYPGMLMKTNGLKNGSEDIRECCR